MKMNRNYALLLAALAFSGAKSAHAQTDLTNTGGTVSVQYTDSPAGETLAGLVDNSTATKYLTFHASGWAGYQTAQPYVVTKYAITSANDFPERDPKSWTFQGSNDGNTWTTINTQTNQSFASRLLRKEYTFTNTVGYTRYRFNFTNTSGTTLQLAEMEIYGNLDTHDITDLTGYLTSQYDYTGSNNNEWPEKVVDNNSTTKYLTFHDSVWIQWQSGNPSLVTKYTLTSANDAPTRDPKNWTLQGSNDGATWATLDTQSAQTFASRGLKREFPVSTTTAYSYFRLNIQNNSDSITQLAEWEIFGTGGGGVPAPVTTWQEHWFDHTQLLTRRFYDNDVAVYYDPDVPTSITWPNQYMGDVWRYVKGVYGDFGQDKHLYVVMHQGKYSGGHPSTSFDASHDYRSVTDVGPGAWTNQDYANCALLTHEAGHIVEIGSKGKHNSPAFPIWGDSKWMEIFQYDVYLGLGQTAFANQWYTEKTNTVDSFPRAGTHWFRDWFYPIYNQHGGTATLNKFFTLLGQNFPVTSNGKDYSRNLNMGEFVHFWSGAAGVNLKAQATTAFGWTTDYENQFNQAKIDFPGVTYTG